MAPSLDMPLFVSAADVITRMGLDSTLDGVNTVLGNAIIGAQLHVQRTIDGQLQRQSRDSLFYLDADAFSGIQPGGMFRLEIPSGFIREDTDITITATAAISSSNNLGPFSTFTAIDDSLMKVNYVRGYIFLDAHTYGNCYVRVICDTGFEDGTTPFPTEDIDDWESGTVYSAGAKVVVGGIVYEAIVETEAGDEVTDTEKWKLAYVAMEQIPNEVSEAIISMVPVVMDAGQTTNRNQEALPQYKKAADHAAIMLQPYVRVNGFSFRPVTA